jgi:Mrp family chromosome partitioning ATPase
VRGSQGARHQAPVHAEGRGPETLAVQMTHVRRYWWLVLGVVVLSVVGTALSAHKTPTTFTGRSSLIVASNDRSPDQDAVLVGGYVAYFNDPAYQSRLLRKANVAPDVTVSAHAAAASPIMLIDATSGDPRSAQTAAASLASTFRSDINRARERQIAAEIVSLQRQIKETLAPGGHVAGGGDAETAITQVQDRILQLRADRVDLLQVLQRYVGVSQNSPRLFTNILLALLGGLVIGGLAALAVGRLSNRPDTSVDLSEQLAIDPLVELPSEGNSRAVEQRALRVRQLANIVRARLLSPPVVAVTGLTAGHGAATVAMALARQWAEEGRPTLLVRATADTGGSRVAPGLREQEPPESSDLLPGALGVTLNPWITAGPVQGMWVLERPIEQLGGPQEPSADSIQDLLAHTASSGTLVVLETSPVTQSGRAQDLCAAAGRTLLAVEAPDTRVDGIAEAVSLLEESNAGPLGAVLLRTSARPRWHRHDHHRRNADPSRQGPGFMNHDPSHGSDERRAADAIGDDQPFGAGDPTSQEPVGRGEM